MGIPKLKIRRSRDRLIFNMGIPILARYLYISWDGPHNDILCTIKWAQKQTTLIWNHQQMTTDCTTSFTVVQPVVTDRNRSHYQSWNCSTNGTTNRLNLSNEQFPRQYQKVCCNFRRWTNGLPGVKCCTRCVNPNPHGETTEEGNCSYLLPLSHRDPGTFRKLHNGLTRI